MSAPTDKAAKNIVVVCRIHYISVIKQELGSVKTWEPNLLDDSSVINRHNVLWPLILVYLLIMVSFLRYTGYLNFIKDVINHVLWLISVRALLLRCIYF